MASGGQPNCTPNCSLDKSNAGRSGDLDALAIYVNSLQFPIAFTQMSALQILAPILAEKLSSKARKLNVSPAIPLLTTQIIRII